MLVNCRQRPNPENARFPLSATSNSSPSRQRGRRGTHTRRAVPVADAPQ
jgi:hypothetical protein